MADQGQRHAAHRDGAGDHGDVDEDVEEEVGAEADGQQPAELVALESSVVTRLDEFRAPLTPQEYDRRRPEALPAQARKHLDHWGYPFVLDLFSYHLTLSDGMDARAAGAVLDLLSPRLSPLIAAPMRVNAAALVGEDEAGFFHLIEEFPLRG